MIPYRGFGPGNAGLGFVRGLGFGTQAPGNVAIGWMDLGDARRPLISFSFFLYQSVISTYYYLGPSLFFPGCKLYKTGTITNIIYLYINNINFNSLCV